MNYQVTAITELTPTHISVLLSDDVSYDVDRGAFEEYIGEDGMYDTYTTFDQYWDNFSTNDTPHKLDVSNFIASSKSTQLDIDVVRAWENISKCLMAKDYEDIKAYATAIKNQITYQNQ